MARIPSPRHRLIKGPWLVFVHSVFRNVDSGVAGWVIGLNVLAALAKITGLLGVCLTTLYLVLTKRYREAGVVFAGSLIVFLAIYGLYGWFLV